MTEIRSLAVVNTGTPGSGGTIALEILGATKVSNVRATASYGQETYGIYNGRYAILSGVTAMGSSGTSANYGISASVVKMTNVYAIGESGPGTADNYGIKGNAQEMNSVTAIGSGGAHTYGLFLLDGCPIINNSTLQGHLGSNNYGVYIGSSCGFPTKIINSFLIGASNSIVNPALVSTFIATSSIDGPIDNSGDIKCVASYNSVFEPLGSNCQ